MADARIYQPCQTAMQQGKAMSRQWLLEFEQSAARTQDPLMGWTSSTDMRQQLRLEFESSDDAIAYALRNGISYRVIEPRVRRPRKKSYAENFR